MSCSGVTQKQKPCSRTTSLKIYNDQTFCWQHYPDTNSTKPKSKISGGRQIGNLDLFQSVNDELWEDEYERIMEHKYAKNTRNFKQDLYELASKQYFEENSEPPIFLIPRTRGGPSYKSVPLSVVSNNEVVNLNSEQIIYCPVSKGYPMQNVSSFTLGPIFNEIGEGEGLCLVNAAFSKSITVNHIEGGGQLDLKRKTFWRPAKYPLRKIVPLDGKHMEVDGQVYPIMEWLRDNESLWLDEWEKWRKSIAMCNRGDFHWSGNSPTIAYRYQNKYLNFVEWKKKCYIQPSYKLLPETDVVKYLWLVWKHYRCPLGLVHPMSIKSQPEKPITREFLREMFDSPNVMCCQPYVVAGFLLGVPIYE